jgi:hypothetical protein
MQCHYLAIERAAGLPTVRVTAPKVFISSTFHELKSCRAVAAEEVRQARWEPVMMEDSLIRHGSGGLWKWGTLKELEG